MVVLAVVLAVNPHQQVELELRVKVSMVELQVVMRPITEHQAVAVQARQVIEQQVHRRLVVLVEMEQLHQ